MSWAGISNNQCVSDTNLKDAVTTGVFTAGATAFPSPTLDKEVTKARCNNGYIVVPNTAYPPFALKPDNQIITKQDIYVPGDFTLDPAYGKYFTGLTGTNLPSFTFNVTSLTTKTYNGVIPAQNISVNLSGNAVTSPIRVSLYLRYPSSSVLVQSVAIAQNGATSATLTLPNDVASPTEIRISVDSGSVPPAGAFTFGSNPVNNVAVSKTTGQYQIASIGTWAYNGYGVIRFANTGGYLCYSSDYGATWYKSALVGAFTRLAISDDGQYALAATQSGYVYRSTNYGVSWTAITTTLSTRTWSGVSIGPNSNVMYACSRKASPYTQGYVFKSTDYGATWSDVTPASNTDFTCIDCGGTSSASVIVGIYQSSGIKPGYYLSVNGASSWNFYYTQ